MSLFVISFQLKFKAGEALMAFKGDRETNLNNYDYRW